MTKIAQHINICGTQKPWDNFMLWALIISIILKTQIKQTNRDIKFDKSLEHTPGFYELESIRLKQYSLSMNKKLESAMKRHERAANTMFYAAHKCKPSNVQNRAFFRLLASDNRVLHARKLASNAAMDLSTINATKADANEIINTAYDLAYLTKLDLLKYRLSQIHEK